MTWAEQFKAAVRVGDDEGSASAGEWIAHIISLPFKLIFALTPPAHLGGGWPCFFVALLFIAGGGGGGGAGGDGGGSKQNSHPRHFL